MVRVTSVRLALTFSLIAGCGAESDDGADAPADVGAASIAGAPAPAPASPGPVMAGETAAPSASAPTAAGTDPAAGASEPSGTSPEPPAVAPTGGAAEPMTPPPESGTAGGEWTATCVGPQPDLTNECAVCMCDLCPTETAACDGPCWEALACARPCLSMGLMEVTCITSMCPTYGLAFLQPPIAPIDACLLGHGGGGALRGCEAACAP